MDRIRTLSAATALLLVTIGGALAADAPPGAASCSGCHPTSRAVTVAMPRLAGADPAQFLAAMQGFKSGQRPATVMDRIAKGFTDDELRAMAQWFAAQKD
jgi:sulfide dehydrogenase cytochrome subunit